MDKVGQIKITLPTFPSAPAITSVTILTKKQSDQNEIETNKSENHWWQNDNVCFYNRYFPNIEQLTIFWHWKQLWRLLYLQILLLVAQHDFCIVPKCSILKLNLFLFRLFFCCLVWQIKLQIGYNRISLKDQDPRSMIQDPGSGSRIGQNKNLENAITSRRENNL